jgi:hypothetical protein
MIKAYDGMTYEEVCEASLNDWRFIARGLIYSEETERRFAETVARLWADFATERVSVEEFCDGFYRWLDSFYEVICRSTRYLRDEDVPSWARKVDELRSRGKLDFTLDETREFKVEYLSAAHWLESDFFQAAQLLCECARNAPKLAKSSAFARLIRRIILTERFDGGRRGFIEFLLPVTKFVEGIDLRSFALDPKFAGHTFAALSKLKDGRFVAEAETVLRENPNLFALYRKRLERYINRYKPAE